MRAARDRARRCRPGACEPRRERAVAAERRAEPGAAGEVGVHRADRQQHGDHRRDGPGRPPNAIASRSASGAALAPVAGPSTSMLARDHAEVEHADDEHGDAGGARDVATRVAVVGRQRRRPPPTRRTPRPARRPPSRPAPQPCGANGVRLASSACGSAVTVVTASSARQHRGQRELHARRRSGRRTRSWPRTPRGPGRPRSPATWPGRRRTCRRRSRRRTSRPAARRPGSRSRRPSRPPWPPARRTRGGRTWTRRRASGWRAPSAANVAGQRDRQEHEREPGQRATPGRRCPAASDGSEITPVPSTAPMVSAAPWGTLRPCRMALTLCARWPGERADQGAVVQASRPTAPTRLSAGGAAGCGPACAGGSARRWSR